MHKGRLCAYILGWVRRSQIAPRRLLVTEAGLVIGQWERVCNWSNAHIFSLFSNCVRQRHLGTSSCLKPQTTRLVIKASIRYPIYSEIHGYFNEM